MRSDLRSFETVTIVDTVEYEGLKKGQEYKVIGTLMDKETGEPILIDGKPVTAEKTFKAKKSSGTVEVTFTFDGVSLTGKTVVVFEELYHKDLKLAVHADIEDEDQTIYFPEIGTTAKDADTEEPIANADSEVTLIDTVSYKNLVPGQEYTVVGTLMDKETGEALEIEGKKVTSEAVFTLEESEGTTEVTFVFDGTDVKGKTLVVEPMNLSIQEVQALLRFWALETDRMSMEMVQMYLLGGRHMWELMGDDFAIKLQNQNNFIDDRTK